MEHEGHFYNGNQIMELAKTGCVYFCTATSISIHHKGAVEIDYANITVQVLWGNREQFKQAVDARFVNFKDIVSAIKKLVR